MKKATKNRTQDRSQGRYLNRGPPEHEAGMQITRPRRLILHEFSLTYDSRECSRRSIERLVMKFELTGVVTDIRRALLTERSPCDGT
jgi:hypothetical protein